MSSQQTLYVLECERGKYYVGKTSLLVEVRFYQHVTGRGAAWTRIYRPQRILRAEPYRPFEELRITLEYMKRYGYDNVRGADWCTIELSIEEIDDIQKKINAEEGRCYTCQGLNHMSRSCPYKFEEEEEEVCFRCGRLGHFRRDCYARRHISGRYL